MSDATCIIPGCTKPRRKRGACNSHYMKWWYGRLDLPLTIPSLSEKFWSRVDKTDSCWLWTGGKDTDGYGRFHFGGKSIAAHRWAWQELRGPIAEGLVLDHKCYTLACVNPEHLQAVSHAKNLENRAGVPSTNTSGVRGVSWDKRTRRFRVYATSNYRQHYGGTYRTLEEAEAAAVALRARIHTNSLSDRR